MNFRKPLLTAFLLLVAAVCSLNLLAQHKTVHLKVNTDGKSTDPVYTVTYTSDAKGSSDNQVVMMTHANQAKNSVNADDSIIEVEIETPDIDNKVNEEMKHVVMVKHSSGGDDEETDEYNSSFPMSYSYHVRACKKECCMRDSCMKKGMRKRVIIHTGDSLQHSGKHHRMKYVVRRNGGQMEDLEAEMEMIPMHSSMDTTITHISPQGDTIKIHRKVLKDGQIQQEVTVNKHSKDYDNGQFFTYRVRSGKNRMMYRNMRTPNAGDETFDLMVPPMPHPPQGLEEMNFDFPGMSQGIDENADFGKIKVTPLMGKKLIRVSLDLSGKENTVIKINDEKGKAVFEEKIKDLMGKYVRDIDMTGNEKGKYSLSIERGKSNIVRHFTY